MTLGEVCHLDEYGIGDERLIGFDAFRDGIVDLMMDGLAGCHNLPFCTGFQPGF
jgi:hypothetical protein